MGWRVSFGVGPLRYSQSLSQRRRPVRTRSVTPALGGADRYDRRLTRVDRIVIGVTCTLVGLGSVAVLVLALAA